jgi:ABC-type nitrate/sulfonate/bicarbonate transport system substrate-binding protein
MSERIRLALLRGICQTPAYVAHDLGYFAEEGLETSISIAPTAWMVPRQLLEGERDAAVIPWTRVAQAAVDDPVPLRVVCGSGIEEAAVVMRAGIGTGEVASVAVPREGGMKDLTAMALVESLCWQHVRQLRFPSGDAAVLSLLGHGADAAAMVEPYASLCEDLGAGQVIRRTGDIWPGAPGCSLAVAAALAADRPEVVARLVRAYVRGADTVRADPRRTAEVASAYIGVGAVHIEHALRANQPDVHAIRNEEAMARILELMIRLGYLPHRPHPFVDLRFLDAAVSA